MATNDASSTSTNDRSRFENVDWDTIEGDESLFDRKDYLFVFGLVCAAITFYYDYFLLDHHLTTFGFSWPITVHLFGITSSGFHWNVTGLDWLVCLSLWGLFVYAVVPLLENYTITLAYAKRFTRNPSSLIGLLVIAVFVVGGFLGPILFKPDLEMAHAYQPPVFTAVDASIPRECLNAASGGDVCYGTWRYPLGTNKYGKSILRIILSGLRISTETALVTTMIAIPIGTVVGTTAGYLGGRVDDGLMRIVDVQGTIPAFLIYIILRFLFSQTLFLVVLVFGLLSWGGAARMVRSEVLQRREELFVTAAQNAGASETYLVVRHIVPNVSNTVFAAGARLASRIIMIEVGLAYLQLIDPDTMSFGQIIVQGFRGLDSHWWVAVFPVITLALYVAAINVVGDAFRDVLDPRNL